MKHAVFLLLSACPPAIAPCPAPSVAQAIVGGTGDEQFLGLDDAGRAAIVALEGTIDDQPARCTGVLVAESWVVTAAHCAPLLATSDQILEQRRHPTLDLVLARVSLAPAGARALPWADAPPEVGAMVEQAGQGGDRQSLAPALGFIVAEVRAVSETEIVVAGVGESGACGGDSGGPLLARLPTGGVGVVGWLASGSQSCTGIDRYVSAAAADPWLRANLGPPSDDAPCGGIDASGRCYGERAVYCGADGQAVSDTCTPERPCGFDTAIGGYRCVTADPCGGVDVFGECHDAEARVCVSGTVMAVQCATCGAACARSAASGVVGCSR